MYISSCSSCGDKLEGTHPPRAHVRSERLGLVNGLLFYGVRGCLSRRTRCSYGVKDHIAGRLLQRTKWSFMAYDKFVRRKRRLVFYEVRDGLLRRREFPYPVKDQPVYRKRRDAGLLWHTGWSFIAYEHSFTAYENITKELVFREWEKTACLVRATG